MCQKCACSSYAESRWGKIEHSWTTVAEEVFLQLKSCLFSRFIPSDVFMSQEELPSVDTNYDIENTGLLAVKMSLKLWRCQPEQGSANSGAYVLSVKVCMGLFFCFF